MSFHDIFINLKNGQNFYLILKERMTNSQQKKVNQREDMFTFHKQLIDITLALLSMIGFSSFNLIRMISFFHSPQQLRKLAHWLNDVGSRFSLKFWSMPNHWAPVCPIKSLPIAVTSILKWGPCRDARHVFSSWGKTSRQSIDKFSIYLSGAVGKCNN